MTARVSTLPALPPPILGAKEEKERHNQTGIKPAEMNKGCYENKVNTKRINLNKKGENKKGPRKRFLKKVNTNATLSFKAHLQATPS